MIKHVVCFKLKDNSTEACIETKNILMSMEGRVDVIRGIEVGIDFLHSGRSHDIILAVTLDDKDALDAYQNDPYHCEVVKTHMHSVMSSSVSVDYNI